MKWSDISKLNKILLVINSILLLVMGWQTDSYHRYLNEYNAEKAVYEAAKTDYEQRKQTFPVLQEKEDRSNLRWTECMACFARQFSCKNIVPDNKQTLLEYMLDEHKCNWAAYEYGCETPEDKASIHLFNKTIEYTAGDGNKFKVCTMVHSDIPLYEDEKHSPSISASHSQVGKQHCFTYTVQDCEQDEVQ